MAAPTLKATYRFPAPQPNQPAPAAPGQVQNQPLLPPTARQVPGSQAIDAALVAKIGHFYVQQFMQRMIEQGLVFGPQGSQFSGYVDLG